MPLSDRSLGESIRRARERKGWIQQQLADAVGVDRKTVDNWENGRTSPRNKLGKIEEVLDLRVEEGHLVDARGDVRPPAEDAAYVSRGDAIRDASLDELLAEVARRAREANPDAR